MLVYVNHIVLRQAQMILNTAPVFKKAGLNNQRLALTGLCLTALRTGGLARLPRKLVDLNASEYAKSGWIDLFAVFDQSSIARMLESWEIRQDNPGTTKMDWEYCFRIGQSLISNEAECEISDYKILNAFNASEQIRELAQSIKNIVGSDMPTVQLRIEDDWQRHIVKKRLVYPDRHYVSDLDSIILRIKQIKQLNHLNRFYVCCDMSGIRDWDIIRSHVLSRYGISLISKYDIFGRECFFKSPMMNAALDFEVARHSLYHVGPEESSFFSVLKIMRERHKDNLFAYDADPFFPNESMAKYKSTILPQIRLEKVEGIRNYIPISEKSFAQGTCKLPHVTVIIPVWNEATAIAKCLEALAIQDYPIDCFDVCVVDNGSTDATLSVLRRFEAIFKKMQVLHESKPGSYAARNRGLLFAVGDYVAFTDADCRPEPSWLRAAVAAARSAPEAAVIGGRINVFKQQEGSRIAAIYERAFAFKQKERLAAGYCTTANWLSPLTVVRTLGGFDARLRSGGDFDLSERIRRAGGGMIFAADMVVQHPARISVAALARKRRRTTAGFLRRHSGIRPRLRFLAGSILTIYRESYEILKSRDFGIISKLNVIVVIFWLVINVWIQCVLTQIGVDDPRK